VEPFFSDVELNLDLFGGSVVGSAGGIEQSVVGEKYSLAIRVSWHVVDVKAKNMGSKTRALRHACKYFAREGIFVFNFNMEASLGEKRTNDGDEIVGHCEVNQFAYKAVVPDLIESLFHIKEDCCSLFSSVEI
jgi:hypothetical protein